MVSALFNLGSAPFDSFFPSLAMSHAGLDEAGVGKAKAALACISLVASTTISAGMQKRLGTVATCVVGLATSALGLSGIAVSAAGPTASAAGAAAAGAAAAGLTAAARLRLFWLASAVYSVGVPLYGPTVPTMLLQCVPRHRRATIMGLDGVINTVARIVAPPALGLLCAGQALPPSLGEVG